MTTYLDAYYVITGIGPDGRREYMATEFGYPYWVADLSKARRFDGMKQIADYTGRLDEESEVTNIHVMAVNITASILQPIQFKDKQ